jgi:hypothetical protein
VPAVVAAVAWDVMSHDDAVASVKIYHAFPDPQHLAGDLMS